MATLAQPLQNTARDERFFLFSAVLMTAVMVSGFSLQFLMGRSTFASPPLVHAHAIVFFGYVFIYLAQNLLVAAGAVHLHRRLGWIGALWVIPMLVLGVAVIVVMARRGHVPFFFRPIHFLVFDTMSLVFFAGLTAAAIRLRRRTDWHRRLHFCGMALLLGPGFGRLLPLPLFQPWAWEATVIPCLLFPIAGMIADRRRSGRVHPAWKWGFGAMLACVAVIEAITYSPLGPALYDWIVASSPGASVPALEFAPPPAGPLITGR
jgi:hypothetical protein